MMSYLVYRAPNETAALRFGSAAFQHDFLSETGPVELTASLQALCSRKQGPWRGLRAQDLTTGSLSEGNPETVAPTSVVIHRTKSCEQRRRAWALAAHWSSVIEATSKAAVERNEAEACLFHYQYDARKQEARLAGNASEAAGGERRGRAWSWRGHRLVAQRLNLASPQCSELTLEAPCYHTSL